MDSIHNYIAVLVRKLKYVKGNVKKNFKIMHYYKKVLYFYYEYRHAVFEVANNFNYTVPE